MIWKRDEALDRPESHDGHRLEGSDGMRGVAMGEQGTEVTVVGQGARLEGTIVSAGSLRVDGQVKGKINADGDVLLSPQSVVDADISAQNVTVAGRFKGNIVVKGTAELARGGRVEGNITSKTLVVQEGGVFSGQSIMGEQAQAAPAQPPAKGATVTVPPAEKGGPEKAGPGPGARAGEPERAAIP